MGDTAWVEIADPADGTVTWRFDRAFMESRWTCTWGCGCLGILDRPAADLQQGCCSVGAQMADDVEAMTVSASAAAIPLHLWQHHTAVDEHDVFRDSTRRFLKVVDSACIFLNRPGFEGGAGCALHLAAVAVGERPLDWKPSVCWQAPLKAVEQSGESTVVTVRPWRREDWGAEGPSMAWCCTDQRDRAASDAFVGEVAVIESLADELSELVGEAVYVELRRRLADS